MIMIIINNMNKVILVLFLILHSVFALKCDAGEYLEDNSIWTADTCKNCASGKYRSQNNHEYESCKSCTTASETCDAGENWDCPKTGIECTGCLELEFQDATSHQLPCKSCVNIGNCTKGTSYGCNILTGVLECDPCPIDHFQDTADHNITTCAQCTPCGANKGYDCSDQTMDSVCTTCPNGYYQNEISHRSECIESCGNGKQPSVSNPLVCEDCPTGRYSDNINLPCKTCFFGKKFIDDETACIVCPSGQYQEELNSGDTTCKTCAKGKIAFNPFGTNSITYNPDLGIVLNDEGAPVDDNNIPIFYPPGLFVGCQDCVGETYQELTEADSYSCKSCQAGKTFLDTESECFACAPGKFSNGDGTCAVCDIGFYQDQENAPNCNLCDVDDASLGSGYGFSDEVGLASCKTCSTVCPAGEAVDAPCIFDTDLQCVGCDAGQYRSTILVSGEYPCLFCEAGKEMVDWSNPGTSCTDCLAGKYQPSDTQSSAVCVDCLPGFIGGPGRSEQCTQRKTCGSEGIACPTTELLGTRECGTVDTPCDTFTCCRKNCDINAAATQNAPYNCQCSLDTSELCEVGEYCTTRTSLVDRTNAFCSKGDHTSIPFPHQPDCKPLKLVSGNMVPDTEATSTCQCWQGELTPFTIGYDSTECPTCSSQCTDASSCNSRYGHCVSPDYCSSFNGVGELDVQTGCLCEFPLSYNDQYEGNTAHTCVSKYCRAKLTDTDKCSDTAIGSCKNKLGLYPNTFPDNNGGLICGCGLSGLCDDTVPYCVGSISLCSASPGTPCVNINGDFINPSPCACSKLDIDGNAIGTPDGCEANMYCDAGVCSNAKCPTTGLCTNNHIIGPEETFYFEGYTPNAKCVTEECDEDVDIVSCCERCFEWNEDAGRCGIPCPEFFDCEALPSMPNYVRPPGNYRYDTEGLQIWEIERFNTGKFDDVCSDGCSETNPQNVETCCLRADRCDEHHQNSLCVNTDNFADPSAIGSWDGSKICVGHQCRPEECCDFISCTCENGTPAFPPQCVNNTNVCQEVCDEGYFKINATHCFLGSVCAADEYMYQIPNLVFDTRCKLLNVCIDDVEYISANETDATVNGTGTNKICSPITLCDYDSQFQEENYTLYSDRVCTNVTVCNTSTHFELTPATKTVDRVCTELSPPCNYGEYIAQSNNLTHDRICLSIDFADCAISEFMFQNYSETQNRICEPLTVCDTTQFISVNATIDSDLICSNLTECDFTQQYIRILATDFTDRKCSALRECSGFEFISVNETTTSNRVCTPLSKCSVTEYAAPQNTTYFDRVCSTCEADGKTADRETCLGCMTEGNCKYDQSALVQDDASCFSEQCTTYTLNNMTFTNDSGTYDMKEIVLINDDWVRFDVIGGVEPDITVTGDIEKVYNDLNELVYLYFQVPVTVEDFNATLNDTHFLLRQNCVVTILLQDKCVSDPLVDLCDSNYTRPGQQAIWWEIKYPPLEGGQACPGNPIDPYYVDCVNYDCDRDCNETCPDDWSDCLNNDRSIVECEEEGNRTKICQIHTPSQYNGIACTPNQTELCVGAIPSPFCDCDENVIDDEGVCGGSGCPLGTFLDLCGVCNGTNDCYDEFKRLTAENESFSNLLYWGLIIGSVMFVSILIYWVYYCCLSCGIMQSRIRNYNKNIYLKVATQKANNEKIDEYEKEVARNYVKNRNFHDQTYEKYKDDVDKIDF
jgi:hypothetical protein